MNYKNIEAREEKLKQLLFMQPTLCVRWPRLSCQGLVDVMITSRKLEFFSKANVNNDQILHNLALV
jgi:hypothetical protein